ncbi:MAG: cytochrome c oxidase subunit II [Owenweeksia sp.]
METLLIIIVGILGLIAIAQAVRVFELSADVKGEGADSENVTDKDNRNQGMLLLIFMIFMMGGFIAMVIGYNDVLLPVSASEHGHEIDNLWDISMWLIVVVFFITQPILFYFGYKFSGRKGQKAVYMEHNNRLEFIWTIVPAVVLAGLIIYGLSTWSDIMNPSLEEEEPMVVEIYAKQFGWTARYSGEDNQLGFANVRMIEGANTLGVDPDDIKSLDDVITPELHLPVNKPVLFKFRSQDVIHSAYLPHFRVQMNCVPGTKTQFMFKPTMTTEEMRLDPDMQAKVTRVNEIRGERGDDAWQFDYVLLCNKICGSAHYNMQMKIVVESEEEYNKWMSEQKSFAELL